MRVNAAKGITSNQPLIADCRPLMLGRQEAAFNLVWLDHSSRGSRYSSSQHTPHWRVRPKQHRGLRYSLCRHLFILSDEMTPLICWTGSRNITPSFPVVTALG